MDPNRLLLLQFLDGLLLSRCNQQEVADWNRQDNLFPVRRDYEQRRGIYDCWDTSKRRFYYSPLSNLLGPSRALLLQYLDGSLLNH